MPFDLDWKGDTIPDSLEEPFHQANEVLGRKFTNEITSAKWNWPTTPSPRDIVDTGQSGLRGSYAPERTTAGGQPAHDHSWNMEYAMAVHEGAKFKPDSVWGRIWIAIHGKPVMPARPWTEEPLESGVLEDAFERLTKAKLR